MSGLNLTHLKQLAAESIYIIREVAAEFENPVMLYSIGKDSAVMLHLAMKAFHPGIPPFPLMHIDTTFKFKEMIKFREEYVRKELGLDVIVHTNQAGVEANMNPFDHGSQKYTHEMKTVALKEALDKHKFDAASVVLVETKKSRVQKNASIRSVIRTIDGTQKTSDRNFGISTTAASTRARAFASSHCRIGRS